MTMSLSPFTLTKTHHHDTYPSISSTNPSLSQSGKSILITGGGTGLGFQIARSFAKAGASRIIIVSRRIDVLDAAAAQLQEEFKHSRTKPEFIPCQGDIGNDASISSLWDFLNSQNIFVHVLVLNAARLARFEADTLRMDKQELMDLFDTEVGGNFHMTVKFVNQPLRPVCQQLNLIYVSTVIVHMILLGRIADEHPVEDIQIISYHPGAVNDNNINVVALPADFAVWAASPEASWLHGKFVWAHWDVDELKADEHIVKRLEAEQGFLRVAVQGLGGSG